VEWTRQHFKLIRRWDLVDKETPYRALREDLFDEALQLERSVAPELNYLVAKELDPLIAATEAKAPLPIPQDRVPALHAMLQQSQLANDKMVQEATRASRLQIGPVSPTESTA